MENLWIKRPFFAPFLVEICRFWSKMVADFAFLDADSPSYRREAICTKVSIVEKLRENIHDLAGARATHVRATNCQHGSRRKPLSKRALRRQGAPCAGGLASHPLAASASERSLRLWKTLPPVVSPCGSATYVAKERPGHLGLEGTC